MNDIPKPSIFEEYLPYLEALKRGSLGIAVAGRMYRSAAQTIADTTDTKVGFDTADFAAGVTADTTNGRFTVTTAGYYLITGQVLFDSPASGKYLVVSIQLNGSGSQSTYASLITNGTNIQGQRISDVLYLDVGDYVELFAYHNCGGNEGLQVGSPYTFLTISKI